MQKLKEKLKDKTAFQVKKLSFFLSGEKNNRNGLFCTKADHFRTKTNPLNLRLTIVLC